MAGRGMLTGVNSLALGVMNVARASARGTVGRAQTAGIRTALYRPAVRRSRVGFAPAALPSSALRLRGGAWTGGVTGVTLSATASLSSAGTTEVQAQAEEEGPKEKFRKDYAAATHTVKEVELDFQLKDGATEVTSTLTVEHNPDGSAAPFFDGEDLEVLSLSLDGKELDASQYTVTKEGLTLSPELIPKTAGFTLKSTVKISPEANTQLSGLYKSGPMYCSQCEAEGFRRITFFQDRPDVMATFKKVRIEADKNTFPVLLSNGNKIESGEASDGRHFAVWQDPFPKPSYLFALVAGDLGSISSSYHTMSGRDVHLEIYSEKENVGQLDWAMQSLKKAMKWDEDTFGLEYDLDLFNIVAVNDFNMGAMENKGLNVFNTAYVLAKPETATDGDFEQVEGVIGHEYFHNWTGNRVTCRDWFQLTLKEGLTVFRDQQFSSDMGSHAVNRIENVRVLRARQFPEDNGPLAHSIRPESYVAMDNFYTATVYVKGAEVIRMYHTLLGKEGFRKGMDLYFKRHDGSAVTCDDFRAAMSDANGMDLEQFERWYLQYGTPQVEASGEYDASAKTYTLRLKQSTPTDAKQPTKLPFHIPVKVGLLTRDGKEVLPSTVLELKEEEQEWTFKDIPSEPVPSLLRDFSAPVKLRFSHSDADLAFLMAHDTDSFNRWEAGQQLSAKLILSLADKAAAGEELPPIPQVVVDSFRATLTQSGAEIDRSLQSYALGLPTMSTLAEEMKVIDPDALKKALGHVKKSLATALRPELETVYDQCATPEGPYVKSGAEVGRRRLRNTCLTYLAALKDQPAVERCLAQFKAANCMTDKLAALSCLADLPGPERDSALDMFYKDAGGEALVLNKWFGIQASADVPDLLTRVKALLEHPDFTLKNPNRLRSVISVFSSCMDKFHAKDGSGYEFVGDMTLAVDKLNPQVAARLAGSFAQWRRFDKEHQDKMLAQCKRIKAAEGVSKDTLEVATRCLA